MCSYSPCYVDTFGLAKAECHWTWPNAVRFQLLKENQPRGERGRRHINIHRIPGSLPKVYGQVDVPFLNVCSLTPNWGNRRLDLIGKRKRVFNSIDKNLRIRRNSCLL